MARRRGIDYNTEIPLEKKAPLGFFDPTEDDAYEPERKRKHFRSDVGWGGEWGGGGGGGGGGVGGGRLTTCSVPRQIEGPQPTLLEEQKRKEDQKRIEELKKKDLPAALMKINKMAGSAVRR